MVSPSHIVSAIPSASGQGLLTLFSAPVWGSSHCRESFMNVSSLALTMTCTMGCRGTLCPNTWGIPPPPSTLSPVSAGLFLSVSCFPTPEFYTTGTLAGFKPEPFFIENVLQKFVAKIVIQRSYRRIFKVLMDTNSKPAVFNLCRYFM